MDKNRLIQIANHFDKIGAYTVSDEFENKFIRTAAPADEKLFARNQKISDRVKETNVSQAGRFFSGINQELRFQRRNVEDLRVFSGESWNLVKTWQQAIDDLSKLPAYSGSRDKKKILDDIFDELVDAEDSLKAAIPASVTSAEHNGILTKQITDFANNEQSLLALFVKFVNLENRKYKDGNQTKYFPYINNLTRAETLFYNLDRLSVNAPQIPLPTNKPTPAPTPAPTKPAPASTAPASTAPAPSTPASTPASSTPASTPASSGGSSSGGTRPPTPNQGGGGRGAKPSATPSSKPSSENTPRNVNEALAIIVFRKLRADSSEIPDEKVLFQDMREVNKLKAYLHISKNPDLKGSIRNAIDASSYSKEFKQALRKKLDERIARAIELNKPTPSTSTEPTGTPDTGPAGTSVTGPTGAQPPTNSVNTQSGTGSSYTLNFTCNREGLLREIQRVEDKSTSDVDQFARDYFTDIYRITECHSKIRPSLVHEDNIYIDVKISQLRTRYFSYINRTQFPY